MTFDRRLGWGLDGLVRVLGVIVLCLMVAVSPTSGCHGGLRTGSRTAAMALLDDDEDAGDDEDGS